MFKYFKKKRSKFVQIAATPSAKIDHRVCLYALDDMGVVWIYAGDDGGMWIRLTDERVSDTKYVNPTV